MMVRGGDWCCKGPPGREYGWNMHGRARCCQCATSLKNDDEYENDRNAQSRHDSSLWRSRWFEVLHNLCVAVVIAAFTHF
jgi:hypothetical protein